MGLIFLICLLILVLPTAKGTSESYIPRYDFIQRERSPQDSLHELIFCVRQKNVELTKTELYERSTPGNPKYQQWLTSAEVKDLIQNDEAADAVHAWLASNGLAHRWESFRREYIKVVAPIGRWEALLQINFYQWEDLSKSSADIDANDSSDHSKVNRGKTYTVPPELDNHISGIFNTVQVPPVFHSHFKRPPSINSAAGRTNLRIRKLDQNEGKQAESKNDHQSGRVSESGSEGSTGVTGSKSIHRVIKGKFLEDGETVTVAWLNSMYEIDSNTGSALYNQSVFETAGEYYSQDDSFQFQETQNLPSQQVIDVGGFETSSCNNINDCNEGNLDVQYINGVAQKTGTIYWYMPGNDPFVDWITAVADEPNPPKSNSISWGSIEQYNSKTTMTQFDYQAMVLGLQGVTVTVSTGDQGVSNSDCNCDGSSGEKRSNWEGLNTWQGVGYFPSFPATSPHVTAVGATMGPGGRPSFDSEIVCQADGGGVITSGGGFSTYYQRPEWQNKAVTEYFANLATQPDEGFNLYGRAYPDVAFTGVYYEVVVDGVTELLFGTSASSPVMAALVTLVNTNRLEQDLGPIGFLNPTLYLNYTNTTYNDITSGDNKCCSQESNGYVQCCSSGFVAAEGWDPTTGWGSMSLPQMGYLFSGNISNNYVPEPNDGSSDDDSLSTAAIVGISAAVVIVAVIGIGIASVCFYATRNYGATTTITNPINS